MKRHEKRNLFTLKEMDDLITMIQLNAPYAKMIMLTATNQKAGTSAIASALVERLNQLGDHVLLIADDDAIHTQKKEDAEILITVLKKKYDYVIIDTKSCEESLNYLNLAGLCDGVILVVEFNKANYVEVRKQIDAIKKTDCQLLGTIFNKSKYKHKH